MNLGQLVTEALTDATHKAKQTGHSWAVVDLDDGLDTVIRCVDVEHLNAGEFADLDTSVVAIVHPDGAIEV